MKLRQTSLVDTIARKSASASCSDVAGGSASAPRNRMLPGTVASISASSDGMPRVCSISRTSVSEGPMWRETKVSGVGIAGTGIFAGASETEKYSDCRGDVPNVDTFPA